MTTVAFITLAAVLAFGLSAWLTHRFCDTASYFHVLDHPNERSLHTQPTPRSGGIALLAGLLGGSVLIGIFSTEVVILYWLFAALLPVALVSFVDDRAHVPVWLRFLVHLSAAALLIGGAGLTLPPGLLPGLGGAWLYAVGALATLLYVVWMINLYNFMDGMDGFAGGMALIGFGAFAVMGFMAGHTLFAALSLVISAAAAGFLRYNFPPARIFMGDTGSSTLGLLAASLSLWAARDGIFPFWVGLLVFSPFIVDATVTLGRRLWRGERVWQAHKTHYYQRLVQLGWGHRRTVLHEYALMLACGLSAVLAVRMDSAGQWWVMVAWCGVYLALMAAVPWLEKKTIRS